MARENFFKNNLWRGLTVHDIMTTVQDIRALEVVVALEETAMGRKRKDLKLHRVKGYYITYTASGKLCYKYFGTRDLEEAYQAYRKWTKRIKHAESAGKSLAELDAEDSRRRMKGRKLWAQFILSLPDDFSGGKERAERLFKQWMHKRRRNRT